MLELKGLSRLNIGPVNLTVEAGECVSLSGRSGSGKSVLLRAVADLDPHQGEVFLDGRACSSMPAPQWRRMVTYVAAESGWWEQTVRQHFPPGTDFHGLLPQFGLEPSTADMEVQRLSTGERQRLALLRALCLDSKVLLLDEPTSALDHQSVLLVEAVLRQRVENGVAIVMVTHDTDQALRLATRHLRLQDGRLESVDAESLANVEDHMKGEAE